MKKPTASPVFAPCDGCGEVALLSPFAGLSYCPACLARSAAYDAARDQLEAAAAPIVGAWASFWSAEGLALSDLLEITEDLTYIWANKEYGGRMRRAHLRRLRRAYPVPSVEAMEAPKLREAVDFAALPLLTAFLPEDPRPGASPSPVFLDGSGQVFRPGAGLDTLTLSLPDGVRAVMFTGFKGRGPYKPPMSSEPSGFRIPAYLWEAFARYIRARSVGQPAPLRDYCPQRRRREGRSMTRTPSPATLAHLPRVSGLTLHAFPFATLTLEDGSSRDMGTASRAAVLPPTPNTAGFSVLVMAWDRPDGEVFAVPPEVLPEVLRGFPEKGKAARLEVQAGAVIVQTCAGDLYTFAWPVWYSVGQSLDGDRPDTLSLKDASGWPLALFEVSKDTPGAARFYSREAGPA